MANRENISVSFTPQQTEFLSACIGSGRYQSLSEVVREALRLLEHQLNQREAELERAKGLIQEGVNDLGSGNTVDDKTFFEEWEDQLAGLSAL